MNRNENQTALLTPLAAQLAELADRESDEGRWPEAAMTLVERAGVWKWVIPQAYGGTPLDSLARIQGYEEVSAGSLSISLIVTQQHGACELIADGDNAALKTELLPAMAEGRLHCTIGISHLTTSKRGGPKQLRARPDGDGFIIDGRMPWSSGPAHCDGVVTAAEIDDTNQILAWLPLDARGVEIGEPMQLMALEQSWTTWVGCNQVRIAPEWIIRGPGPKVLSRRSTVKPLTVSAVGSGVAAALLDLIIASREKYPTEFGPLIDRCRARFDDIRRTLHGCIGEVEAAPEAFSATAVRTQINDLVTRLALVAMTLAKGSGYVRDHRAQRLCREAMFFLVWSTPQAAQLQTLEHLLAGWDD